MEFLVLGPLEVRRGDEVVSIGSRMERALLTALLVDAGTVVSTARLIEVLWGEDPPPSDRNSLQTYVARLRHRLGGAGSPVITRPPGYLIDVDPTRVDALRFEALLGEAARTRAGDPDEALGLLDEALALWRGRAFAEFADEEVARAEAVRLGELRENAADERVEALLAVGRTAEAIGDLEAAVAARPLRERPFAQLMGALARSGRQVEALACYQRYRDRLVEEVGLEPSTRLRELQGHILRGAPHVAPEPPPAAQPAGSGNLPAEATSFVGRERAVAELVAVLERTRVVTLMGPGGVGKTRLALRAAGDLAARYRDGAWVVELAPLTSPGAVAHAVAGVLGVRNAEAGLAASAGPDDPAQALPYEVLADVWSFSGRLDEAFDAYGEAVRLGRLVGDHHAVVYGLVGQALARAYPGDVETALGLADQVQRIAVASGNPTALAWALYARGEALLEADPAQALTLLEEGLEAATSADNVFVTGVALLSATSLRGRHGEPGQALRSYRDAIEHWHRRGNRTQQWITLRNLTELLARVGADEPAAVVYGATTMSATAPPTFGPEAERLTAVVARITRGLGRDVFDAAVRRGGALGDDEVVGYATTAIDRFLAARARKQTTGSRLP